MLVAKEIEAARSAAAGLPRPLGFVPTMGALHAGHLRLIELSRARCAATVVSSFVNPAQFAPGEDLERYPRDPVGDREKLERSKADLVFAPRGETMYPPDFSTFVDVGSVPEYSCTFPFRVPDGTKLKSLQIESASLDLSALDK